MDKGKIMYIIGVDFGNGESSAAMLAYSDSFVATTNQGACETTVQEANETTEQFIWDAKKIREAMKDSFRTLTDLNIVGDKTVIKSSIYKDPQNNQWYLDADYDDINYVLSDLKDGQYPEFGVYFKGPLVDGKGGRGGNTLVKISDDEKKYFGEFVKCVYNNILDGYTDQLHRNQRNFKIFVACPSEWEEKQIVEFKSFLIKNGLPVEDVIEESRAAYMSFRDTITGSLFKNKDNNILVIDYGSSTIDFTWYGEDNQLPVHDGCDNGAKEVERLLFEEIKSSQKVAQEGFGKFVELMNGNKELAEQVMIYAMREVKEAFYKKLPKSPRAQMKEIPIATLITPASGETISTDLKFGFDRGVYYDKNKVRSVLEERGYIEKVRKSFREFKNRDDVGKIDYVILTGGASKMDFVTELVEEVFEVKRNKPIADMEQDADKDVFVSTLKMDDKPSTSISRGIAKFGLYHYLSEPIKMEIENSLQETWRDHNWLLKKLDMIITQAIHSVYNDKLNEKIAEWAEADQKTILSREDHNLEAILSPVIDSEIDGENSDIWKCVKTASPLEEGQRSLHAFLRCVYDYIQEYDKFEEIGILLNNRIREEVNSQVGELLNRYVDIYFEREDEVITLDTDIPAFESISFEIPSKEKQISLLKLLIVSAFKKVKECDGEYTNKTFNKNRSSALGWNTTRNKLIPALKSVVREFSDNIEVSYSEDAPIEKICLSCQEAINNKFDEIKYKCNLSTYRLK